MKKVALVIACLAASWPAAAIAQNYPTKPIKMIVPISVGSITDVAARLTAQELEQRLGQSTAADEILQFDFLLLQSGQRVYVRQNRARDLILLGGHVKLRYDAKLEFLLPALKQLARRVDGIVLRFHIVVIGSQRVIDIEHMGDGP